MPNTRAAVTVLAQNIKELRVFFASARKKTVWCRKAAFWHFRLKKETGRAVRLEPKPGMGPADIRLIVKREKYQETLSFLVE